MAISTENSAGKTIGIAIDPCLSYDQHPTDQNLESLIQWSHDALGTAAIIKAKEDFYWRTGKVFPDEAEYQARMNYFIDYFIFERLIENSEQGWHGKTPFQVYCDLHKPNQLIFQGFCHSLFIIRKVRKDVLHIKDLITSVKYQISQRSGESFIGLEKSTLFQGFLYHTQNQVFLSRGLVYHNRDSKSVLKRAIKAVHKQNADLARLLCEAAKCQLNNFRHPRVGSKQLYKLNSLVLKAT